MVEELEVINDNDEQEIIEVTDALPKIPEMLSADSDDEAEKAPAKEGKEVVADCDFGGGKPEQVLEIVLGDSAEAKGEVAPESEVVADAENEVITEEFVTADDDEREAILNEINEIADSADRTLNIRVPFINNRATKNAVVSKFLSLNKHLLDKKFHSLVDSDARIHNELYRTMLDNVKANAENMAKLHAEHNKSRAVGFIDTGKGYFADVNF